MNNKLSDAPTDVGIELIEARSLHTPAPWILVEKAGNITIETTNFYICSIDIAVQHARIELTNDDDYIEDMANAKLIAAAPEMWEALNEVRDQLDKCRRLLDTDYDINTALELANKVIGKVQS